MLIAHVFCSVRAERVHCWCVVYYSLLDCQHLEQNSWNHAAGTRWWAVGLVGERKGGRKRAEDREEEGSPVEHLLSAELQPSRVAPLWAGPCVPWRPVCLLNPQPPAASSAEASLRKCVSFITLNTMQTCVFLLVWIFPDILLQLPSFSSPRF